MSVLSGYSDNIFRSIKIKKGFSLMEILIATALFSLFLPIMGRFLGMINKNSPSYSDLYLLADRLILDLSCSVDPGIFTADSKGGQKFVFTCSGQDGLIRCEYDFYPDERLILYSSPGMGQRKYRGISNISITFEEKITNCQFSAKITGDEDSVQLCAVPRPLDSRLRAKGWFFHETQME